MLGGKILIGSAPLLSNPVTFIPGLMAVGSGLTLAGVGLAMMIGGPIIGWKVLGKGAHEPQREQGIPIEDSDASAPEPATLVLIAVGFLFLLFDKKLKLGWGD